MANLTAEQIEAQQRKWLDEWAKKMIEIWRDKLTYWSIKDTGKLMDSFKDAVHHNGLSANILMHFLDYGIYQAYGVGRGYKRGNGGNLYFLDPKYREEHNLGEPRQRRDWFNPKLFGSMMRLRETMARMIGEEAAAVICDALDDARKAIK